MLNQFLFKSLLLFDFLMGLADKVYHYIKLLLYTAEQESTVVTPSKLQKIFFLLKMEKGVDLGLDFRPWIFGVYSKLLQEYIDALIELGEVVVEEEEVRDPLSDEVIAYNKYYRLNTEFKPEKEDKEVTFNSIED